APYGLMHPALGGGVASHRALSHYDCWPLSTALSLATALSGLVKTLLLLPMTCWTAERARAMENCASMTTSQRARRGTAAAMRRSCWSASPAVKAAMASGTHADSRVTCVRWAFARVDEFLFQCWNTRLEGSQ